MTCFAFSSGNFLSTGQKRCRANWNTDDTDFTNLHGFFGMFHF
ncbi:MAG: hypothetical protein RLZZ628_2395 [Bacteroidota bacterium]|jgi:hypothetical protein